MRARAADGAAATHANAVHINAPTAGASASTGAIALTTAATCASSVFASATHTASASFPHPRIPAAAAAHPAIAKRKRASGSDARERWRDTSCRASGRTCGADRCGGRPRRADTEARRAAARAEANGDDSAVSSERKRPETSDAFAPAYAPASRGGIRLLMPFSEDVSNRTDWPEARALWASTWLDGDGAAIAAGLANRKLDDRLRFGGINWTTVGMHPCDMQFVIPAQNPRSQARGKVLCRFRRAVRFKAPPRAVVFGWRIDKSEEKEETKSVYFLSLQKMSSPTEFTPIALNTDDADAWDDTELVVAFDNAIASHRLQGDPPPATSLKRPLSGSGKPRPKRPARAQGGAATAPTAAHNSVEPNLAPVDEPVPAAAPAHAPAAPPPVQQAAAGLSIPPPPAAFLTPGPASSDGDLGALLAAWYEAGYRAGVYAARQPDRARDH